MSGSRYSGTLHEAVVLLVGGDQSFYFDAQRLVSSTGFVEKGCSLIGAAFKRRLKQFLHCLPSLRLHCDPHLCRSVADALRPNLAVRSFSSWTHARNHALSVSYASSMQRSRR